MLKLIFQREKVVKKVKCQDKILLFYRPFNKVMFFIYDKENHCPRRLSLVPSTDKSIGLLFF